MLQDQVIPISLDGGIDSKTNPKVVVAGKFLFVENGVYTNPGEVEKRNGYTAIPSAIVGGGNLAAPKMVRVFNGEMICQDSGNIYGYSPSQSAWVNKGGYTSTDISRTPIDQVHSCSGYVDSSIFDNYTVYVWSTVSGGTANDGGPFYPSVYASVLDNQTGAVVAGPTLLSSSSSLSSNPARCVLLGNTAIAVVYSKGDGSALVLRLVSLTAGAIGFGSEQTVTAGGYGPSQLPQFDITSTQTGAVIVYQVTTGVNITLISSSGVAGTPATISDTHAQAPFFISVNPTSGNIWVYWVDQTYTVHSVRPVLTAGSIWYATFTSSLSPLQAATSLVTLSSPYIVSNVLAISTGSNAQTLYFGLLVDNGNNNYTDATYQVNFTSGQSGLTPFLFGNGITPLSRSFSAQSASITHTCAVFVYRGMNVYSSQAPIQPTYFLIDLSASTAGPSAPAIPVVVGRFAAGLAGNQSVIGSAIGGGYLSYSPSVSMISSSNAIFPCGVEIIPYTADFYETQTFAPGGLTGVFAYSFQFQSARAYLSLNAGSALILNGGCLQLYDGQACTEWGFHLSPEITSVTGTTGGSMISGALYNYIAIFQWVDAQGNIHQSEPSTVVSLTLPGGNTAATITVSTAFLSSKQNLSVALYRTKGNGSVYYLVTDPVFLTPAGALSSVTARFTDQISDAALVGGPQAYHYSGSSAVSNTPPPPSMILATHNNRVWYVDSENPNTVGYTKSYSNGTGLSPSDFLIVQVDPKLGNIAGLAEMDDKMIVAKDRGFFWFAGDGFDDTGANSTLTAVQSLPVDQGCNSLKSLIMTPNGLFFKGPKGIYLLDRSLQSHYVGAEVEKWNAQSITAATMVADKSQIRFLTDSGVTLVYDYAFNKWSYFTNHQGYAADNFQGAYTYATTSGAIFQENTASFLDNATAYSLRARLGWLAMAGVQGFQRVRRLGLLGDYSNGANTGHGIQISAAYDYVESFLAAVAFFFGGSGASGTFQYRERLIQQKCEALSLLIEEITTGASGETVSLTNLSLEAGVKRGIRKSPASQTVG